ncbi:hypothetical protein ACWERA_60095, partial [Streptomyces mirabilis]
GDERGLQGRDERGGDRGGRHDERRDEGEDEAVAGAAYLMWLGWGVLSTAACAPAAPVSSSPVASAPTPAVANALVLILMVIRSFPVVESGRVPGPGRTAHPVTPGPTLPGRHPGAELLSTTLETSGPDGPVRAGGPEFEADPSVRAAPRRV